ncbi:receptor-like protein 34 [Rhododendron vialii]|uniref:receptor-like protein 34 n=1 Tax=Rhododendron vialii TaxID=182163 RepID=UPI00265D9C77|nr:receptor-like protein 34 [Rhododendron vialii]
MERLIWLFLFLFHFFLYQSACSSPLSSSPSLNHSCSPNDRSSLLQFKQMFIIGSYASSRCDDLGYLKTLSWNETTNTDCCSWDGVTCDVSTGHVTGLDLSCSKLYGTIHPNTTLFQLSHLQQLNLGFNHFNFSPVSPSFSHFTSLSHLNLSSSFLSGSIPSEIAHLSKLVSLDLTSSWDDMSKAGILRLEPHNFKALLMNLTQLENLKLNLVNISSGLPDSLLNLSSLATLDLAGTRLNGKLPDLIGYLGFLNYLDLSSNELSGPLPESLGNLTRITVLYVSKNDLNGQVPSTLSNLEQLTYFSIAVNNLDGTIPEFFSKLTKLEYLDLAFNNFNGPFPRWVANLTQLVFLGISSNPLTAGPIPNYNISEFRNLKNFFLSNISLNGTLPSWLFSIPSLQRLDLGYNQLTGQIHEFQHDSQLEFINLSNNKLHGPIPQSISSLVNLRYLNLSSNNLSGVVELQKFSSNLQNLDLSKNNISVSNGSNANATMPNLSLLSLSFCDITKFPEFLQNSAPNLVFLDLSNNKIHGEIPKWVEGNTTWPNLSSVDLSFNNLQGPLRVPSPSLSSFLISHNKLTGEIPSSICNLSSLQILVLSNNNLNGVIPPCLGNVSNHLEVLDLRRNGFHGAIPTTFANGSEYLRSLNLNGNHLEGPVPRSLANCKSMEVLDLGNNDLYGAFPHWLESLPELQVLVLKSNRFHGPIGSFGTKAPFPKLRIFDISQNNFIGLLPERYFLNFKAMMNVDKSKTSSEYMGDFNYRDSVELVLKGVVIELEYILTVFTTIDLSYNNFRGEIPSDIGKLQGLRLLNLSHNTLSGCLPSLLRNITILESLDLSSNQLTGKIPRELTSLTFLAVLNFSKNHLVGPIPHGNQFDTFQNDSYIGNSGLCGLPLSKKCGDNEAPPQPISPYDDNDSDFASGFTWRIVLMGYGCGLVIGVTMGFVMFLTGRPRWFTRIVGSEKPRRKVVRVSQIGWRRSHRS